MKRHLFVLWFLAASTVAHAATAPAPETTLYCWDQTFAYNGFRVERTDQRLYVSLSGSTLVAGERFDLWNFAGVLSLANWNFSPDVVVSFDLKDCVIDEITRVHSCTSGDLMIDQHDQSIFVPQKVDHLGQLLTIISRYFAQKLTLDVSPERLTLVKEQRFAGSGEVLAETLQIDGGTNNPIECDTLDPSSHVFPSPVSTELVEHLE